MVVDKKVIHFGYFVRWRRETVRQWTRKRLALEVGMTERRLAAIEELPEPKLYGANMAKLSAALGMEPDELRTAWKVTPVPVPVKRKGRTFETVTIKLPRDAYDRIAAIAKQKGRTVEDHIVRSAGGAFGLLIESTQPQEGEEAPDRPEPSASVAPSKKGNRCRSRSAPDRDG